MHYYKTLDSDGNLTSIGIGYDGIEITEEEYNAIAESMRAYGEYLQQLIDGTIDPSKVPEEWREELVATAEAIIKAREEAANQPEEISAEEALNILLGGETA